VTSNDNHQLARDNLFKCIKDLGERAIEIDEPEIAVVLLTLAASIEDDTYPVLGYIAHAYALKRAEEMSKLKDDGQL